MRIAGSRVLVTGASGFVGRHVLAELSDAGRILAMSRGPADARDVPRRPTVEWIHGDVADRDHLRDVAEKIRSHGGVDLVVHLAGYYDFTGRNAPEYRRTNVEGLSNVVDLCRELRPELFVFASSVAACDFPECDRAVAEDTPADGDTPYARSKRDGEEILKQARRDVRSCIVRFAALFSDWCEYEPLHYFLDQWLSAGWRSRILAGHGDSAIPFLHVRDAMAFLRRTAERRDGLESADVLLASPDGATSHRQLHRAATAAHYGARVEPILLPRSVCRAGIVGLNATGAAARRPPFERPWMGRCIDRQLRVDASRTRARLGWAPKERLGILRRLPFLVQNRKAHAADWLRRNHVGAKRTRLRAGSEIHARIASRESEIRSLFDEYLNRAARRGGLPSYLGASREELERRHELLLEQLMAAVRTGDKGVFVNCCRHLAERWYRQGLPLQELWEALESLGTACATTLRQDPTTDGCWQAIHDNVTMTFRFAVDAIQEMEERFSVIDLGAPARKPRARSPSSSTPTGFAT